jgi:uracil DNA glycosylase
VLVVRSRLLLISHNIIDKLRRELITISLMSIIAGVLWLNTSLTVGAHKAGSHKGHWEEFTDKVLKEAVRESKGVVVMAWGAWAQKRAASLDKVSSDHNRPLH